ncbi:MAG: nickel pincer cofactor biosynthesis protein LarC, partial [Planctomycetota bacterium]
MKHLHIDMPCGIAGDMLLGALLDLGAPPEALRDSLAALPWTPPRVATERVLRGGIAAVRLLVEGEDPLPDAEAADPGGVPPGGGREPHPHPHHDHTHDHTHGHDHDHDHDHAHAHAHDHGDAHSHDHDGGPGSAHGQGGGHAHPHAHGPARTLPDMLALLDGSTLPVAVRTRAAAVFRQLAEAEAAVHGKAIDAVHFHEVAGVDTIVDVVGACALLEALGVACISAGPFTVGTGFVTCAHGRMPAPAPATARLLAGRPVRQEETGCELTTPTGAALAVALASSFGPLPAMTVDRVGWGAGRRDLPGRANAVRLLLGTVDAPSAERDAVCELSFVVDDMTGEAVAHAIGAFLEDGALDAWAVPCVMKKGRPGQAMTVLAAPGDRDRLLDRIFRETGTFGLRMQQVERAILDRAFVEVAVDGNPVRVKVGRRGGRVRTVAPEYEDCRRAAVRLGLSLQ